MAEYKVYFRKSVETDLGGIPKKDLRKILQRIKMLAQDPRPAGHEELTGQERYRIAYCIQDEALTVWIVKVGHRKDVYR